MSSHTRYRNEKKLKELHNFKLLVSIYLRNSIRGNSYSEVKIQLISLKTDHCTDLRFLIVKTALNNHVYYFNTILRRLNFSLQQ